MCCIQCSNTTALGLDKKIVFLNSYSFVTPSTSVQIYLEIRNFQIFLYYFVTIGLSLLNPAIDQCRKTAPGITSAGHAVGTRCHIFKFLQRSREIERSSRTAPYDLSRKARPSRAAPIRSDGIRAMRVFPIRSGKRANPPHGAASAPTSERG